MADGRILYTDGACLGNPGPGGWAWLEPATGRSERGGEPHTTNQRMELTAVVRALSAVRTGEVVVRSDSQYVVRCFRESWYARWRANGFRNAKGDPVANRDLWEELLALVLDGARAVTFEWVRGHAGDPANEEVDRLAQLSAREAATGQLPPGAAGVRSLG